MSKRISFIFHIFIVFLLFSSYSQTAELKIIPLKKPLLTKEIIEDKISKNIIKPKKKPIKKINEEDIAKDEKIKPEKKPIKKEEKEEITIVDKNTNDKDAKNKITLILPKNKPLVVKKELPKTKKSSKFYRKKDFEIAEKSIILMKKKYWSKALSTSKKAKDKSIYRFIQWRHLLSSGNQASFYDYQQFINNHPNYPRINRIKYLAEHKLSTKKITSTKIIKWFGADDPLSGYGKLIFGESLIETGDT